MSEIRKECNWQLCNTLWGVWGRIYEKVGCFWVV